MRQAYERRRRFVDPELFKSRFTELMEFEMVSSLSGRAVQSSTCFLLDC